MKTLGICILVYGIVLGFTLGGLFSSLTPGLSYESGVEAMGGMKTMGHAVRPAANLSYEVVGRMNK